MVRLPYEFSPQIRVQSYLSNSVKKPIVVLLEKMVALSIIIKWTDMFRDLDSSRMLKILSANRTLRYAEETFQSSFHVLIYV